MSNPLVDAAMAQAQAALSSLQEKTEQLTDREQLTMIRDLQKIQLGNNITQQLWGSVKDKLLQQIQGKLTAELGGLTQKAANALGGFGSNPMVGMAMQMLMGKANGIAGQITAMVGQQIDAAVGSFAGDLKAPIEQMTGLLDDAKGLNINQKMSGMFESMKQSLMANLLNDPTGFVTAPLQFMKNGLQTSLGGIMQEAGGALSGINQAISILQDPSIPDTVSLDEDALMQELDALEKDIFGDLEEEVLLTRGRVSKNSKFTGTNLTPVLQKLQTAVAAVDSMPNLGLLKKVGTLKESVSNLTTGLDKAAKTYEKWAGAVNGFDGNLAQLDILQNNHPFGGVLSSVLSNVQTVLAEQKTGISALKASVKAVKDSNAFVAGSDLLQMSPAEMQQVVGQSAAKPELPLTVPQLRSNELSRTIRTPAAANLLKAKAIGTLGAGQKALSAVNSFQAATEAISFSKLTSLATLKNPASILTPGSPIFDSASKAALDTMKSAVADPNFLPDVKSVAKDLKTFRTKKFDNFMAGNIPKSAALAPLQSAAASASSVMSRAESALNTVDSAKPTVSRMAMNSLKLIENAGFDKAYEAVKTGNWKSLLTMNWENATLTASIMADAASIKGQFDAIKADTSKISEEIASMQQQFRITEKNLTSALSLAKTSDARMVNRSKDTQTRVRKLEEPVKLFQTLIKNVAAANKFKK